MPLLAAEETMWNDEAPVPTVPLDDEAMNARYVMRGRTLVLESNREKLENFVISLRRPGQVMRRPEYQRRLRWDNKRMSRFIESFILNIPIPPLFLFEVRPNEYEVIDGQQRITAIDEFFSDRLVLAGLEYFTELNGRKYSTLPLQIRTGIERRSISYIVVLGETVVNDEDAFFLKRTLFTRLNTGGVHLTAQEIRNSLYAGPVNDLIRKLSEEEAFRRVWAPSQYDGRRPRKSENHFIESMQDAEVVLRFFALRHARHFRGSVGRFLDSYMFRSRNFDEAAIRDLERIFRHTFALAKAIYEERLFREFKSVTDAGSSKALRKVADCELVALSERLEHSALLIERRREVFKGTAKLFRTKRDAILKGDSRLRIENRINLFRGMYDQVCEGA
jgi:hypothetical protein